MRKLQARFVEGCWREGGGFGASPEVDEADVEYTFHALLATGSLARKANK
jgi:prenyltransferase beta subunit